MSVQVSNLEHVYEVGLGFHVEDFLHPRRPP